MSGATSGMSDFYGAAAQTIPVLLLTLVVETRFLGEAMRSKRLERMIESRSSARISAPFGLELIGAFVTILIAAAWRVLARPIGVAANAAFAFGSLFAAIAAEAFAFIGLAFDPEGNSRTTIVAVVFLGIGLLLVETFVALSLLIITGGRPTTAQERLPPEDGTSSQAGGETPQ